MNPRRVAVVTGSNKGIGFAIVEGLLQKFEGDVFLTARDVTRGQDAVKALCEKGFDPKFHQLDICDKKSIEAFRDHLETNYGGIDVLVNNAGFAFKHSATEPMHVQAKETIAVNYYGTKQCCEMLFPLLKDGARVVTVSSSCGFLGRIPSQSLRDKFASSDTTLQVSELDKMMQDFVKAAEVGDHSQKGWPNSTYVVSKVGLSALTRIQNREMQKARGQAANITVNYVHPGYVDTDMSSHKGPLSPQEGAAAAVYLATLPPKSGITGQYVWHDCQLVDWVNGPLPAAV